MNSLFNFAFVKEALKRFWSISALTFVVYLFGCILPFMPLRYSRNGSSEFMLSILQMQHFVLIIAAAIVPLITAAALFSFMYGTNSTTALHSLPLRKRTLFASNFLAGFIIIAVPLVLLSLLLAFNLTPYSDTVPGLNGAYEQIPLDPNIFFPNGLQPGDLINTGQALFFFFCRTLVSFMFYFCLFILAAALSGNQVFYILLSIALPLVPAGFYLLYNLISYLFIYGFFMDRNAFMSVFFYSSPFLGGLARDFGLSLLASYVYYFLFAAALLALALLLFCKRKQERAGEGLVFYPFRNAFVFLCSIAAMPLGGVFFLSLGNQLIYLYIGCTVSFALAHIVTRMLTEKTFNVFTDFRPFIKHSVALVVSFFLILFVAQADIGGYRGYVPHVADVSGVYLGYPYKSPGDINRRLITSPDIISRTVNAHGVLIENRNESYGLFSGNLEPHFRTGSYSKTYITYRLTNGDYVKREYSISKTLEEDSGMNDLLNTDEVILSDRYWLEEPENITSIGISLRLIDVENPEDFSENYDAEQKKYKAYYEKFGETPPVITAQEDIESLLAALRADYVQETRDNTLYSGTLSIEIDFELKDSADNYNAVQLSVGERTLEWLGNY